MRESPNFLLLSSCMQEGHGVVNTRRRLARKSEEVADYLIDAGQELVERCEDLYERSGELVGVRPTSLLGNIARCASTAGS